MRPKQYFENRVKTFYNTVRRRISEMKMTEAQAEGTPDADA